MVNKHISQLSWACSIKDGEYDFTIGRSVDHSDDFLFEGVWDGEYKTKDIHKTDFAYGSGARLAQDVVIFVPPKHCFDYLYVIHDKENNVTVVSNSPNLALVQAGVDPQGEFLKEVVGKIRDTTDEATAVGFDRYEQKVTENKRYVFYRMMFYNFTVDGNGSFKIINTKPMRYFKDFQGYKEFMSTKIRLFAENGSDKSRISPLDPITLISSGYDSPCIAALATSLGYKEAATIDVNVKGVNDSGEDIANKLGMNVVTVGHILGDNLESLTSEFKGDKAKELAEFFATTGFGDNVMLKTFEDILTNKIYLSGAMGDAVWRRACVLEPGLPTGITYNKSSTEFRLRVGYAFVPVGAIGARFVWPIKILNKSKEMADYILWEPYDRPFPRRVIEESGIERGTFAKKKAATNPTVTNYSDLAEPSFKIIMDKYRSSLSMTNKHGLKLLSNLKKYINMNKGV